MHFGFNPTGDLLTPTINDGSVNKINELFLSSDFFSLDNDGIDYSSVLMKKDETKSLLESNIAEDNDNNDPQYDLFSSYELPVLDELERPGKKLKNT